MTPLKYFLPMMLWLLAFHTTAQTTDTLYLDVDGARLHAVLSLPANTMDAPLAIIIAGSGPTDLNGNQPMMLNNSLKLLSEGLVAHNIATLRYDKRAIAKSVIPNLNEANLTIDQYAKDVLKLIDYARSKDFRKIYVIGHSEGSLIGLIALQKTRVNGFVSLAGPVFQPMSSLKHN
jgi:uncharacterized protein